jgi:leucyl-tRNA synthetase family protein
VAQKELEQWFFKTTEYARELLEETDRLKGWPEPVLTMQRNWIGRSIGCEIEFPLKTSLKKIRVFTTRQDTLYGATFMSLAPEHPLALELTTSEQREAVEAFIDRVKKQDKIKRTSEDFEKEGVFTGSYCINPVTRLRMPVFLANFVLMDYGTGAVMAVPTHDQRDFEFARKYDLPMTVVIQPEGKSLDPEAMSEAWTGPGVMTNSREFDGLGNEEAKERIAEYLEKEGIGKKTVNYRLRDWGVSRQRYWGTPIPIIYCDVWGSFRCLSRIFRWFCRPMSNSPGRGEALWRRAAPSLPSPAPSAAMRHGGKQTPSTPLWRVPGISPVSPAPIFLPLPSTARRPNTGCRSISTSAVSSTLSCTCFMPAFLPRCCATSG